MAPKRQWPGWKPLNEVEETTEAVRLFQRQHDHGFGKSDPEAAIRSAKRARRAAATASAATHAPAPAPVIQPTPAAPIAPTTPAAPGPSTPAVQATSTGPTAPAAPVPTTPANIPAPAAPGPTTPANLPAPAVPGLTAPVDPPTPSGAVITLDSDDEIIDEDATADASPEVSPPPVPAQEAATDDQVGHDVIVIGDDEPEGCIDPYTADLGVVAHSGQISRCERCQNGIRTCGDCYNATFATMDDEHRFVLSGVWYPLCNTHIANLAADIPHCNCELWVYCCSCLMERVEQLKQAKRVQDDQVGYEKCQMCNTDVDGFGRTLICAFCSAKKVFE